jgi:hypothetical protein
LTVFLNFFPWLFTQGRLMFYSHSHSVFCPLVHPLKIKPRKWKTHWVPVSFLKSFLCFRPSCFQLPSSNHICVHFTVLVFLLIFCSLAVLHIGTRALHLLDICSSLDLYTYSSVHIWDLFYKILSNSPLISLVY